MVVRATIRCSYRPRAMYQASPSWACCTAPGSIRGRSPIRAELFPVGPCGSSRQSARPPSPRRRRGAGCRGRAWRAGAGPDQPALLGLVPEAIGGLGGEVEGAAGIPDPLDELDGGLAASRDRAEFVNDEGGVLTATGLAEGGGVGVGRAAW